MTTLEELKKKRSLQRETEAAARAAREKKAKEGSESSRKAKALLRQPRKLAMIFGGVVLAVGLLQGLMLGGFYLLAQSRLNTYYESVEIGDFETAAEALSGYLAPQQRRLAAAGRIRGPAAEAGPGRRGRGHLP